jgi:ferredoxin
MKRIWLPFAALLILVVSGSWLSASLWTGTPESVRPVGELVFTPGETLGAFLERNRVPGALADAALGKAADRAVPLAQLPLSQDQLRERLQKASALAAEGGSKNWKRILPKLGLWAAVLGAMGLLGRRGWLDRRTRKGYYLGAVLLFGVAFGADPSPMGTVKDAIVLLAREGVVFPPRLVALAAFLLTVVLANKAICAWGCQLGGLQDLIFRLNRNPSDTRGILRQYKVPFAVSNTVRIALFAALVLAALATGLDIIEYVDPFKVFNPAHLGIAGAVFALVLLVASLFVYRPWCHFACPFGLAGWLLERFSLNRIRVDAAACTSCGSCARACPTRAMEAILQNSAVIPDCFACGTCTEACSTKAVSFGRKIRPDSNN